MFSSYLVFAAAAAVLIGLYSKRWRAALRRRSWRKASRPNLAQLVKGAF